MGTSPLCSNCLILFCISSTSPKYMPAIARLIFPPLNLNWIVLRSTGRKKLQNYVATGTLDVFSHSPAGVGCRIVKYYEYLAILAPEKLQKCNHRLRIYFLVKLYIQCALSQRTYYLETFLGIINLHCIFPALSSYASRWWWRIYKACSVKTQKFVMFVVIFFESFWLRFQRILSVSQAWHSCMAQVLGIWSKNSISVSTEALRWYCTGFWIRLQCDVRPSLQSMNRVKTCTLSDVWGDRSPAIPSVHQRGDRACRDSRCHVCGQNRWQLHVAASHTRYFLESQRLWLWP